MDFTKHLERILIEWKGGSVRSSLWSFSVLGCCRCYCSRYSEMIRKQELHEKGTKQKSFPRGRACGSGTRYVCPLHSNNPHQLPWWSKTMLCRVPNEKNSTKAVTQLNNSSRDHTGQQRDISGGGNACGIASTRPWRVVVMNWTKRNRECQGKTTEICEGNSKKTEIGQEEWEGLGREGGGIERGIWTLCREVCEYGRILNEGQVTKREKMVENGWKTRSKIYGTGPNIWGRLREREDKNRRGVPQGAEMRDLVNGRISVVHLNGLLLPSNNNIETKSESMEEHNHPSHGMPLKEKVYHSVRLRWTKGSWACWIPLSPFKDNELQ